MQNEKCKMKNAKMPIEHFGLFILHLAFSAILTTVVFGAARPNILFIMADDHGWQAVSAYGSRVNRTPSIDRIAAEGVRFDRCYVTNSICGPSRACILTGKYSHKSGYYDHYSRFDGSQQTFPKLLQAAGYQTAIIGKWHLGNDPQGFDYWDVLPGQGQYYRPDFISANGRRAVPGYVSEVITDEAIDWLKNKRDAERPFMLMVHHKAPHRPWQPAPSKLAKYERRTFQKPDTLLDDYAHRGTAAKVAEMRIGQMVPNSDVKLWKETDEPRKFLFNRMSETERAAWERYVDPRLGAFEATMKRRGGQSPFAPQTPQKGTVPDEARTRWFYQLYMRDYLACVESVDDSVGELLDYLDESGLAENTVVVYTSDQGFYLGEHGWFDKRFMYEQSLRTPLVVRWPGEVKPGSVEGRIVSNLDFAETFLELAGADVPDDMQGRSFVPLLRGGAPDDWRTAFYYHYYEGFEREHKVHKHEGVTTGRAKLIHFYPIEEWELYDLEKDPHEMMNVYGQPEYAKAQAELHAELERLREELEVPPLE
jgi:arylsulfatase A-like enzyme